MARVIAIISGKGGVGKTTTAINLGTALNKLKKEVIIVDANLNTPNVGVHLGAPIVPLTLNHVLKGKTEIEDAIYEHSSGTKIVPSSLSVKELTKFNTRKLSEVTKKLKGISDFVIFDSAAGFGEEAMDTIDVAEEIIVVTNPEMPAVTDALKAIKVARELGKDVKGVIVTRYQNVRYEMPLSSIKSMLEVPIIGIIPEDRCVKESVTKRDAVVHTHPKSKASKSYHGVARKILGEESLDDIEEDIERNRGVLVRIFSRWRG